jgi:Bacterial membrane protein YfhO
LISRACFISSSSAAARIGCPFYCRWQELPTPASGKDLDNEILHDPRRFDEIAPVRFVRTDSEGPYYFAEKLVAGADARSVASAVFSDVEIPKKTVFVNMTPFDPAPGRVISARRTATTLTLDVEAQGRGFLALAVTPHKYWRATIDGKQTELHAGNVGFQGVVVERGRHRVELRYRNTLVVACAWISALTALVLSVGAGFSRPSAG